MDELLSSWARSLRARARSEATIDAYVTDLRSLDVWLRARGLSLVDATRRLLEEFLAELREQGKAPATIARRYRSFQQFFKWALDEDEIPADPMAKMRPPKVPVQPPPIIPTADLLKLLASCDTPRGGPGRAKPTSDKLTFENKRDRALILMLATTGIRSGELMGLTRESIDLNSSTFTVMGKGGRARIVALMPKPADALDKYLRARRRHAHASIPGAVARRPRRAHRFRAPPDARTTQRRRRHRPRAPAPVPAPVRARGQEPRHDRRRPDVHRRMELAPDAPPLRRERRR